MKFIQCPFCGKNIDDDSNFCMYCGKKIKPQRRKKNTIVEEPISVEPEKKEPVVESTPVVEPLVQNTPIVAPEAIKNKDAEIEKLSAELERMKKEKRENEKQAKKKNSVIAGWLSVLLIAIIGLGVYFLLSDNSEKQLASDEPIMAVADIQEEVPSATTSEEVKPVFLGEIDSLIVVEEDDSDYVEEYDDSDNYEEEYEEGGTIQYKGFIGDDNAITMEITFVDCEETRGTYYYDKYGPDRILWLEQKYSYSEDGLMFVEHNSKGVETGIFQCDKYDWDEEISGTFTVKSNGKTFPFKVKYVKKIRK